METLDEAKNLWQNTNQQTNQPLLNKVEVENIIKLRIKKEKKNAAEYFWLSFAYQLLIYAFACHLIIKYWGDNLVMLDKRKDAGPDFHPAETPTDTNATNFSSPDLNYDPGTVGGDTKDNLPF